MPWNIEIAYGITLKSLIKLLQSQSEKFQRLRLVVFLLWLGKNSEQTLELFFLL